MLLTNRFLFALIAAFCVSSIVGVSPLEESSDLDRIQQKKSHRTTDDLVVEDKYPAETHHIRTEDGYLLQIHRIPNPGKPVVYLQHGILSSSADWVVMGPGKSIAYLLYDAGYDIWMGNSRGNLFSRAHASHSTSSSQFWDFSWHEIGMIDVPTTIDFILRTTKASGLHYVGHSQGTTVFFVLMSQRPEYRSKIKSATLLAPVAFFDKVRALPIQWIARFANQVHILTQVIGMNEFLPKSAFITSFAERYCQDTQITQLLCTNTMFLVTGFDSQQMNTTLLPKIMQNIPAGASVKQLVHFGQLASERTFRMFNYGFAKNRRLYGSNQPPEYDLSKISTPINMIWAQNDLLSVEECVTELQKRVPSIEQVIRVAEPTFNHMDFLYAKDGYSLVYKYAMDYIDMYEPTKH